jgi:hypothetical protein
MNIVCNTKFVHALQVHTHIQLTEFDFWLLLHKSNKREKGQKMINRSSSHTDLPLNLPRIQETTPRAALIDQHATKYTNSGLGNNIKFREVHDQVIGKVKTDAIVERKALANAKYSMLPSQLVRLFKNQSMSVRKETMQAFARFPGAKTTKRLDHQNVQKSSDIQAVNMVRETNQRKLNEKPKGGKIYLIDLWSEKHWVNVMKSSGVGIGEEEIQKEVLENQQTKMQRIHTHFHKKFANSDFGQMLHAVDEINSKFALEESRMPASPGLRSLKSLLWKGSHLKKIKKKGQKFSLLSEDIMRRGQSLPASPVLSRQASISQFDTTQRMLATIQRDCKNYLQENKALSSQMKQAKFQTLEELQKQELIRKLNIAEAKLFRQQIAERVFLRKQKLGLTSPISLGIETPTLRSPPREPKFATRPNSPTVRRLFQEDTPGFTSPASTMPPSQVFK